jgi:hypothetical protein
LLLAVLSGGIVPARAAPPTADHEPPVTILVEWGDGRPRAWAGTIELVDGRHDGGGALAWQSLCNDADAAASIHAVGSTLHVHDARPREHNGVQIGVQSWRSARLVVRLAPAGESRPAAEIDTPVAEVLADAVPMPLDADGNRLTVHRAADDAIRVAFADGRWPAVCPVHRPGDVVHVAVHPLLVSRSGATAPRELTLRVRDLTGGAELVAESRLIHVAEDAAVPVGNGLAAQAFDPVVFDIPLPNHEAVCAATLEVIERGSLRWSRPVATRTIELPAVSAAASPRPAAVEWKVVYELDPSSPRLHERLRRLSGSISSVSVPSLPLPSMKLPTLPFPSMTRPSIPLPKMPNVPIPSVSAMVPRMSGLLASGDSTVEPHAIGTVLRLPPASSSGEPTWEGIVIAGADVGMPHLVEIEYPVDQQASFGVTVLEPDATGSRVESRHAGGFAVVSPVAAADGAGKVGRHAFIFWPSSRNPLVAVMNVSAATSAVFGRVRVFAGPARVPPMKGIGGPAPDTVAAASRRVNGFIATPAGLGFGAGGSLAGDAARLPPDWNGMLTGVRRSAEWLTAQGAGGAMVTVFAAGGAIWPSEVTRASPRWLGTGGKDGGPKDVVGLVSRVYRREGLQFVPALAFDAPLPAVEAHLARGGAMADTAQGLLLVGRDGRPRQLSGRTAAYHYNILDPRVQQAVEEVVGELVARLDADASGDGVAIVMPHDGWMHLPGTAWPLDDATFGRFAADVAAESPGGESRHAARADLVMGPMREAWLDWRCRQIASFYRRLATIVTKNAPARSLYVAPTTLLAEGDIAARLRHSLGGEGPGNDDVWREVGVDPVSITRDDRVVFLSPHAHHGGDRRVGCGAVDLTDRSAALARSAAGAARRGIVAVELPLPVGVEEIISHGAFGSAAACPAVSVHPVHSGAAVCRPWAESFVAGDAEVIFDMGLMHAQPGGEALLARRAFGALPPGPLALVDALPAPLVIRSGSSRLGTSLMVVNASALPLRAEVPLRATSPLQKSPAFAADAVDGTRLAIEEGGRVVVPVEPWAVRAVVVDADAAPVGAGVVFDAPARDWVAGRLQELQKRQEALQRPSDLALLDNPGFELPGSADGITGWEIVDRQRGTLVGAAGQGVDGTRAADFSSTNGLATIRSNPFTPPATGRIGVSAWLRVNDGDPQPPLRLAIEGVARSGEYYRFAPIGGIPGGAALRSGWSQFVLRLDDLPSAGLESLRVRFDLMGPGRVQIDDVRVDGLALTSRERDRLAVLVDDAARRLTADDIGGCSLLLDSFWPRFLEAHVPLSAPEAADQPGGQPIARPPKRWKWR